MKHIFGTPGLTVNEVVYFGFRSVESRLERSHVAAEKFDFADSLGQFRQIFSQSFEFLLPVGHDVLKVVDPIRHSIFSDRAFVSVSNRQIRRKTL